MSPRVYPTFGSLALFISVFVGCASNPPVLPSKEGLASPAELESYRAKIARRHTVRCRDLSELEVICEARSGGPDWIFTRPGHPAHPAVSASIWVWYQTPQGQAIRIDRTGQYGGDKEAYEAWKAHLVANDKRTLEIVDELALAK